MELKKQKRDSFILVFANLEPAFLPVIPTGVNEVRMSGMEESL